MDTVTQGWTVIFFYLGAQMDLFRRAALKIKTHFKNLLNHYQLFALVEYTLQKPYTEID